MKRVSTAEDIKIEREVPDSIGLGDRTEDTFDIEEDRKGWCIRLTWFLTVYNGVEGKYLQV